MPRFDLNGNPVDDDPAPQPAPQPVPAPAGRPSTGPAYQQPGPQYQQQAPPPPQYAPATPVLPQAPRGSTVDPAKLATGIIGLAVVIGVAGWSIAMLYPPAVPAPTSFQTYTLPELSVTIDQPAGWEVTPIDKTQGSEVVKISGGAVFRKGTAMIEIAEGTPYDPNASSVAGIAQLSNSLSNSPADMAAMRFRRLAKNHLWGYRTDNDVYAGNPKAFRYFVQEQFSADHPAWSIGGPVKGYFVTEADATVCVAVVCECRAKDWATLKPTFDRVINSIDATDGHSYMEPQPSSPTIPSISTPSVGL